MFPAHLSTFCENRIHTTAPIPIGGSRLNLSVESMETHFIYRRSLNTVALSSPGQRKQVQP
jgi:hypothetical protein